MSSFTEWIKNSYTLKFVIIGILVLLLLIPTNMIMGLISERQERSNEVAGEVSGKWGNAQTLAGPIINIPYKAKIKTTNDKGEAAYSDGVGTIHILPDQLNIQNDISTDVKHRGIYKAVVYNDKATIKGSFQSLDISKANIPAADILWDQAYVSVYIPDLRGIKSQVVLNWNNQPVELSPGIADNDIHVDSYNQQYSVTRYDDYSDDTKTEVATNNSGQNSSGLSSKITVAQNQKIDFDFVLDLRGSSSLNVIPIGKETNVEMKSNYTTPSFDGAFITDTNQVSEKGFWAKWKVLHLNRSFPQIWTNNAYNINTATFGVNLLVPVDHYQKTMRSAKYAIMFILLTFLVFLFTELLNGFKIHPVQYLLVGLALILFYTLLLSISEQLGFAWAYVLSSAAIIILISLYSKTIFKENRLMALLAGILIILYGFLFIILRSEDYALLIGSIGLFIVLCVVMYLSRKIKWYGEDVPSEISQ